MSLSVEDFFTSYPDFKGSNTGAAHLALVQAKLDEALLEVDVAVCGAKSDLLQGLIAARKLALSPFGRNAKMVSQMGTTVYDAEIRRIQRQVYGSHRPLI